MRHQLLLLPALILLVRPGPLLEPAGRTTLLPDRLGRYHSVSRTKFLPPRGDRELMREYGLEEAERVRYEDPFGGAMGANAYRFRVSEGGRAAFRYLRPPVAAASPLSMGYDVAGVFGETKAVVGGGVTVV